MSRKFTLSADMTNPRIWHSSDMSNPRIWLSADLTLRGFGYPRIYTVYSIDVTFSAQWTQITYTIFHNFLTILFLIYLLFYFLFISYFIWQFILHWLSIIFDIIDVYVEYIITNTTLSFMPNWNCEIHDIYDEIDIMTYLFVNFVKYILNFAMKISIWQRYIFHIIVKFKIYLTKITCHICQIQHTFVYIHLSISSNISWISQFSIWHKWQHHICHILLNMTCHFCILYLLYIHVKFVKYIANFTTIFKLT